MYDYTKDYSKNSHTCLIALGAKVTSSSTPSSTTSNDGLDDYALLNKFFKVTCALRGEARAQFEYLMDTIVERQKYH
jgi:hypothetical protein